MKAMRAMREALASLIVKLLLKIQLLCWRNAADITLHTFSAFWL
jgi:hypothetical protein